VRDALIGEALQPYPDDLTIVTKVGAVRGANASWIPALTPADLARGVHDNLRNLRVDALDVVNLRVGGLHGPREGSIEEQFATLAELQQQGLIRQLGLSNVTSGQLKQARRIGRVVCVQNHYNLVHRQDDALIDELADSGVAYVPFFPLGGFTPLQSSTLSEVAAQLGATPKQTALAWLLHRAPNILLIPGTSSIDHLHENLVAAELALPDEALAQWRQNDMRSAARWSQPISRRSPFADREKRVARLGRDGRALRAFGCLCRAWSAEYVALGFVANSVEAVYACRLPVLLFEFAEPFVQSLSLRARITRESR